MAQLLDKKHYYDGLPYEKFVDPLLKELRTKISGFVEKESSVIDIGSGTGALAFCLYKKCSKIVGIDLSLKMIRHANQRKKGRGFSNLNFKLADAIDLSRFSDKEFDFATFSLVLHEINAEKRLKALNEARRISEKIIIADFVIPLPLNFFGMSIRFIEFLAGVKHHKNFKSFYAQKGINTLMGQSGLNVEQEVTIKRGNIKILMVS